MSNPQLQSVRSPIRLWVLGLGAVGFVAGFLGPALLNPEANLGPLLGIFITGPGAAILGAILGLAVRWLGLPAARQLFLDLSALLPVPDEILSLIEKGDRQDN